MIRRVKDWLVVALFFLSMFLPAVDAHAVNGWMYHGNCYVNEADALNDFYQDQGRPVFWSVGGNTYMFKYEFSASNWYQTTYAFNTVTGTFVGLAQVLVTTPGVISHPIYRCLLPDVEPGLVGNGSPTVFSPMNETAKTLVNTQALMIFLGGCHFLDGFQVWLFRDCWWWRWRKK